ncbi:MAG: hypothetical protein AAF757_04445 [Cyanobacteria bacterium P01_D01_bin.116]
MNYDDRITNYELRSLRHPKGDITNYELYSLCPCGHAAKTVQPNLRYRKSSTKNGVIYQA